MRSNGQTSLGQNIICKKYINFLAFGLDLPRVTEQRAMPPLLIRRDFTVHAREKKCGLHIISECLSSI